MKYFKISVTKVIQATKVLELGLRQTQNGSTSRNVAEANENHLWRKVAS